MSGGKVQYDHRHYFTGDHRCSACAVASSAGKKHSSASSERVTSIGVPNTVVVLRKLNLPASVTSWKGTNTFVAGRRRARFQKVRCWKFREFREQLDQHGISGLFDLGPQAHHQMCTPLGEIGNARRESAGMEAEPQHVDRRLQQRLVHSCEQRRHGRIGRHELPVPVDSERGKRLVSLQHALDRLPRAAAISGDARGLSSKTGA